MGLEKDCPFQIGRGIPGEHNLITDVPSVRVAHRTLRDGDIQTGVTVVMPPGGNWFREKLPAAAQVINGFGKTAGLVQIEEMGTLETPIVLTNTLSVGTAWTALVRYMLAKDERIGRESATVNPVVCECNDGYLNDIRGLRVTEEDVLTALREAETAGRDFAEGAVGAGRGMSCLGFKGGIGSASRQVRIEEHDWVIGALTLCNFGRRGYLTVDGQKVGTLLKEQADPAASGQTGPQRDEKDKGSVIVILATDLPLSDRQLKRLCRRAAAGLARTGSYYGNGSGDIAIAFSTANRIPAESGEAVFTFRQLSDDRIESALEMSAEAVEEAVISALWHAETLTGRDGHVRIGLRDAWEARK